MVHGSSIDKCIGTPTTLPIRVVEKRCWITFCLQRDTEDVWRMWGPEEGKPQLPIMNWSLRKYLWNFCLKSHVSRPESVLQSCKMKQRVTYSRRRSSYILIRAAISRIQSSLGTIFEKPWTKQQWNASFRTSEWTNLGFLQILWNLSGNELIYSWRNTAARWRC